MHVHTACVQYVQFGDKVRATFRSPDSARAQASPSALYLSRAEFLRMGKENAADRELLKHYFDELTWSEFGEFCQYIEVCLDLMCCLSSHATTDPSHHTAGSPLQKTAWLNPEMASEIRWNIPAAQSYDAELHMWALKHCNYCFHEAVAYLKPFREHQAEQRTQTAASRQQVQCCAVLCCSLLSAQCVCCSSSF